MSPLCRFNATCANKLCQFRHSIKNDSINTREVDKDKQTDDGDISDEVNTEDINDSELEDDDDDETEIIFQRFLENPSPITVSIVLLMIFLHREVRHLFKKAVGRFNHRGLDVVQPGLGDVEQRKFILHHL